jgi:hypothetical protein
MYALKSNCRAPGILRQPVPELILCELRLWLQGRLFKNEF